MPAVAPPSQTLAIPARPARSDVPLPGGILQPGPQRLVQGAANAGRDFIQGSRNLLDPTSGPRLAKAGAQAAANAVLTPAAQTAAGRAVGVASRVMLPGQSSFGDALKAIAGRKLNNRRPESQPANNY